MPVKDWSNTHNRLIFDGIGLNVDVLAWSRPRPRTLFPYTLSRRKSVEPRRKSTAETGEVNVACSMCGVLRASRRGRTSAFQNPRCRSVLFNIGRKSRCDLAVPMWLCGNNMAASRALVPLTLSYRRGGCSAGRKQGEVCLP